MAQGRNTTRKQSPKRKKQSQKAKPRRHKGNQTLFRLLFLLLILGTGIVLSVTVFFKIENIVVVGLEHYEPSEIIDATGIKLDDNLFLVDATKIEKQLLKTFPYLEEVSIVTSFPPTIEIHTVPSVAVAVLEQSANDYVLITYNGKILEHGLSLLSWDALLVHGVPLVDMEPGDVLGQWTPEPKKTGESKDDTAARNQRNALGQTVSDDQNVVLRMLHYLFEAMEETGFDSITNVDLTDRFNMEVRYENRMILKLGSESDLSYKLNYAQEILFHQLHPDAPGILDLAEVRRNRVYYKFPEGYRNDGTRLEDPPFEPGTSLNETVLMETTPSDEGNPVELPAEGSSAEDAALDVSSPSFTAEDQEPNNSDASEPSNQRVEIPLERLDKP